MSRHIFIAITAQLIVFSLLLIWLADMTTGWAIALSVAGIVAVRGFLVVLSFLLTWWFEDQSSKLHIGNPGQRLSMMLNEIFAELRLFFYYHPLEGLLNSHDSDFPPHENQAFPILFVHGFYNNAGFWMKHKSYFRKNGLAGLYSLNLDPPVQDIECFADQLAQRIQQVCQHSGRAKVILIAHSMGGLVCRACIARSGSDNIERLITIGTPHQGTVLAKLLPGRNLSQMRPDNPWLNLLNETDCTVLMATHVSMDDNIIVPRNSARYPGAVCREYEGIGHLSMAFSGSLQEAVLNDAQC